MMKLLITAFALVGILSAPAFFRSPPAPVPAYEVAAECMRVLPTGVKLSLQ